MSITTKIHTTLLDFNWERSINSPQAYQPAPESGHAAGDSQEPDARQRTVSGWPFRNHSWAIPLGIGVGVIVVTLFALGQPLWCACGGWAPISLDVWSRHNSQHAVDAYTLSHISHGLLFWVAMRLLIPRRRLITRFSIAVAIETFWEILENTPMIINRYREATISLDYFGDSITNSVFDLLACTAGFAVANRFGCRVAIACFFATELVLLFWIRDSLVLNVIMLTWPIEIIRDWQNAA